MAQCSVFQSTALSEKGIHCPKYLGHTLYFLLVVPNAQTHTEDSESLAVLTLAIFNFT